jgi:hypothetical protein
MGLSQTLLTQETDKPPKKDPFQFEKYSLQFMITSNFNLLQFQGSLISFKYHVNNHHAIRIGMGLGTRGWSSEEMEEFYGTDSSYVFIEGDRSSNDFDLTSQWIYYFKPRKVIKFFFGAGPMFFYNQDRTETRNIDTLYQAQVYIYDYQVDNTRHGFGISTVYGVEWFFHKQMSLLGEYGFEIYYYENKFETERIRLQPGMADRIEKRKIKEKGWTFYSASVKLGLSVYF